MACIAAATISADAKTEASHSCGEPGRVRITWRLRLRRCVDVTYRPRAAESSQPSVVNCCATPRSWLNRPALLPPKNSGSIVSDHSPRMARPTPSTIRLRR